MKPRSTTDLLNALTGRTRENIRLAEALALLSPQTLHRRPRPDAWNALQCIAHLNFYSDYYLPEMRKQIAATKYKGAQPTFTSSWLGNKFATGMKPGEKMRKISAPSGANPDYFTQPLRADEVLKFLRHQQDTLELLSRAAAVDLTRTKTGTSLSPLIRLRLGDTLRVVIYHNWRHLAQALVAVKEAR